MAPWVPSTVQGRRWALGFSTVLTPSLVAMMVPGPPMSHPSTSLHCPRDAPSSCPTVVQPGTQPVGSG